MASTLVTGPASGAGTTGPQIWRALSRGSFAVLSHATPEGSPRSSGVVYAIVDHTMYVVVRSDSWKARHVAQSPWVAVTVPVRRGGLLSLLLPIPPATISFHGTATIHPAGTVDVGTLPGKLVRLLPAESRSASSIVEIHPDGWFVTYGVGVPLMRMRHPALARARVPVSVP